MVIRFGFLCRYFCHGNKKFFSGIFLCAGHLSLVFVWNTGSCLGPCTHWLLMTWHHITMFTPSPVQSVAFPRLGSLPCLYVLAYSWKPPTPVKFPFGDFWRPPNSYQTIYFFFYSGKQAGFINCSHCPLFWNRFSVRSGCLLFGRLITITA